MPCRNFQCLRTLSNLLRDSRLQHLYHQRWIGMAHSNSRVFSTCTTLNIFLSILQFRRESGHLVYRVRSASAFLSLLLGPIHIGQLAVYLGSTASGAYSWFVNADWRYYCPPGGRTKDR